jgi:hypothetical protein
MRIPSFTAEAALAAPRDAFTGRAAPAAPSGIVMAIGEGCGSFCEKGGEHCCCRVGERCVEASNGCWCEDAHLHVLPAKPIWR